MASCTRAPGQRNGSLERVENRIAASVLIHELTVVTCNAAHFAASCGAPRMAQSAAHLVDQVIPRVPVRQWVLSFPIPLRILFAAHPELLTPLLRIIHRVITRGFCSSRQA